MSSKSLAVKYRPYSLDGVLGQENAKKVLSTIFKKAKSGGDTPGTLLITGDTGLGKTTLGRIVARTLNCAKGTSCHKCSSCKIFDSSPDSHPDYFEVNAANARGIDDIREHITLSLYAPAHNIRVIMLDEAHQLTPQAGQALLKSLEEPPGQTLFIIATTNPEKLPRAFNNRAVRLHLEPVDVDVLAEHLKKIAKEEEGLDISKHAKDLAMYSNGMVRDAISSLERVLAIMHDKGKITKKDVRGAFELGDEDTNLAAVRVLLGAYTNDRQELLKGLSMTKDMTTLLTKMTWMNGYCIYSILQQSDKSVRNPYYATPENRRIFAAVKSSTKDLSNVLAAAVAVSKGMVQLQQTLLQPGLVDPVTCAIACLTPTTSAYK